MKTSARLGGTLALLIAAGCGGEGPDEVAERFWIAAQEKDMAAVEAVSTQSETTSLDFDNEDSEIRSFLLQDAEVDEDEATVDTRVVGTSNGRLLELSFQTVLVREDGAWLVEVERTGSQMMAAVFGSSLQELGEAMTDGMQKAMQEMAEGMAEGMQQMAEEMGEAFERAETADTSESNGGS
jgi:hypothetical protein